MKSHQQSGFTLIEVLIAITILAFLMVGVYTIVSNSVDTKERVLSEDKSFVQVMRALDRLQSDINQLWSPLYAHAKYNATVARAQAQASGSEFKPSSFRASERFVAETVTAQIVPAIVNESKSEIIFFTAANRRKLQDSKQSRYAWVKHSLRSMEKRPEDEGKEVGSFEWIRSFQNENLWEPDFNFEDSSAQVLLRGLKSLEFTFWDDRNEKYVDRLQDSTDPEVLRVLRVTLVWIDSDGLEQTFTRVMRPVWPFFDTKKDETEKDIFRKRQSGNPQGPGGDSEPPPEDGEEE